MTITDALDKDTIMNVPIDEIDVNKAAERWESIGFLAGIEDDETKRELSKKFEELAMFFLFEDSDYSDEEVDIQTVAFPLVRRLAVHEGKEKHDKFMNTSMKELCDSYLAFHKENAPQYKDKNCDLEAEMVALFCEKF